MVLSTALLGEIDSQSTGDSNLCWLAAPARKKTVAQPCIKCLFISLSGSPYCKAC